MQPTDKRIATVEQWQALKGVIDGNIGKARVLTANDYNYPTDNPTSVALWLLEPGVYTRTSTSVAVQYFLNNFEVNSRVSYIVSSTSGGANILRLESFNGSATLYDVLADGTRNRYWDLRTVVENNLTSTSSTNALSANQGRVLKGLIDTEVSDRQTADANLQTQIDAISAGSDVTDIVGTKAELNNYDTSALGNNDIIKVLADESEGGATTYYRWSTTTSTFTLIGEEGPYYTKTQADTLLAGKQDTLTAGANITISNNTISATDTTYTAGTGIDITNGVISTTGGGGPNVVQSTGTSTTDVMSQNAVTSMVFADPATRQRVKIGDTATSSANNTIAIGPSSSAEAISCVAIGGQAVARDNYAAVAIGSNSLATGQGSIALGRYSSASQKGEMNIGSTDTGYGYNNSNYRLLSGLYDGQNDHDAVTVGQLNTAIAGVSGAEEINATDWSALWQ